MKMQTPIPILALVIAFSASLPAFAETDVAQDKSAEPSTKSVAAKSASKPRDTDVMQGLEAPAAGPTARQPEATEPISLPYVTFDGANNPIQ